MPPYTKGKPGQCVVYTARDQHGRPLYVGCSAQIIKRLSHHKSDKAWFAQIASVDLEHLPGRLPALKREAELIRELKPKYNRDVPPERRFAWVKEQAA